MYLQYYIREISLVKKGERLFRGRSKAFRKGEKPQGEFKQGEQPQEEENDHFPLMSNGER
jgi:hypothetical protein